MKKKIIGIFVCMLLIATAIVSATNVKEENIETTSNEVDVPVWKVGDTWTYDEHYNEIAYRDDGTPGLIWFHNCTSTYTVMDDTGDTYIVKLTSENNEGSFTAGPYRFKYTRFTKLIQELEHRKTDLAYMRWFHQEKGFVIWLLGRIGFPIPAHFSLATEASFDPANELIPFPLSAGKNGTVPGYKMSGHSKVSLYFGLFKLSDSDFSYDVPAHEYMCEMANISVPAGTYEAYNISSDFYFGSAHNYSYDYYAPEVGYFVKLIAHNDWDESGKPALNYHHELISTNYEP
jgi:hypothetical protein